MSAPNAETTPRAAPGAGLNFAGFASIVHVSDALILCPGCDATGREPVNGAVPTT